jgi:hypothetical protein
MLGDLMLMFASRSRARSRLARRLSWLVVLSLTTAAVFAPGTASVALGADPVATYTSLQDTDLAGNPSCNTVEGLGYSNGQDWGEFKLEGADLGNGSTTVGSNTITITLFDNALPARGFTWTSNFGVDAVIIKTGNGNGGYNTLAVYAPEANSPEAFGGSLTTESPTGISHISFCWDNTNPVVTPSPTPVVTPSPTPVVTPEPTPVVTPSPTPVVTPEPTPVVTPEPTPVVTPEPTPVVTPEPTPVVTPEPTPVVTPEPTPLPSEEPNGAAIRIIKVDNNGTLDDFDDDVLLDGASFAVRMDDGDSVYEEDEDSLVFGPAASVDAELVTDLLQPGSYWIVETLVPAGFVGSDPILVELNTDSSQVCLWDFTGSLGCEANDFEEDPWTVVIVDNAPEAAEPTPAPTGGVGGATGTPQVPGITLPPTDALGTTTSAPAGESWRLILLAMAGLMAAALVLTPASAVIRKDDSQG